MGRILVGSPQYFDRPKREPHGSCNIAFFWSRLPACPVRMRLELSGGLYHVTSRGDRREDIFVYDIDREVWLETLAQCCERYNWAIHAWCQMTNHYHLIVETAEGNLSAGMRQLNGVYTQKLNRRHGRVGHVFQGRFKGILVERDGYLLELARYVVLNPVRAGMVKNVRQWKWSSYPAMVGTAPRPGWLHTDWVLGQFGAQRAPARALCRIRAGRCSRPACLGATQRPDLSGLRGLRPDDAARVGGGGQTHDKGNPPAAATCPGKVAGLLPERFRRCKDRDGGGICDGGLHAASDCRRVRCALLDGEPGSQREVNAILQDPSHSQLSRPGLPLATGPATARWWIWERTANWRKRC